jgi:hypothetical protein
VVVGSCIAALVLALLGTVVGLLKRGRDMRARVAALDRFEGSVQAQYGAYVYEPPLSTRATGGGLSLTFGRGQRVIGLSVMDEPTGLDAWLAPIAGEACLVSVTDVCILNPEFGNADVELLVGFPDLREIDVSDCAISDAGLIRLASIDRLTVLNVRGTRVSGRSLRELAGCRELRELDLRDTQADAERIQRLQEALPDCRIKWDGD